MENVSETPLEAPGEPGSENLGLEDYFVSLVEGGEDNIFKEKTKLIREYEGFRAQIHNIVAESLPNALQNMDHVNQLEDRFRGTFKIATQVTQTMPIAANLARDVAGKCKVPNLTRPLYTFDVSFANLYDFCKNKGRDCALDDEYIENLLEYDKLVAGWIKCAPSRVAEGFQASISKMKNGAKDKLLKSLSNVEADARKTIRQLELLQVDRRTICLTYIQNATTRINAEIQRISQIQDGWMMIHEALESLDRLYSSEINLYHNLFDTRDDLLVALANRLVLGLLKVIATQENKDVEERQRVKHRLEQISHAFGGLGLGFQPLVEDLTTTET